ncbi:hypothetical protein [Acinetobacter modestus]|uniref:hypothetical protein n=1 Tax=Acinetobacter modestus TaxID=1776740 RepID=UPI0032094A4E
MKIKSFSILAIIIAQTLTGCSSETKDRKAYIEQCMYPNKAIKMAVDTEASCGCRYDTIRKAYGKPFFNKPIETEEDQKKMDFARGYTVGKCSGV